MNYLVTLNIELYCEPDELDQYIEAIKDEIHHTFGNGGACAYLANVTECGED
jgi:hypothetical protein